MKADTIKIEMADPTPDHGHVIKINGKEYEVVTRVHNPGLHKTILTLAPYIPPETK